MKLNAIIDVLEEFAPKSLAEEYDNSGLQIGDPAMEIKGVMISLDCTEAVINEAIQKGCNVIISHHPLIFSGLKKISSNHYTGRAILNAIKNDVAVYSIHTNLDNISYGVNLSICRKLNLEKCSILKPKNKMLKKLYTFCPESHIELVRTALFKAGCGNIGDYDSCSFNTSGYGTFKPNAKATPFSGSKNKLNEEKEIRIETVFPAYAEKKVVEALKRTHPYEEVAFDIITLENISDKIGSGMIGELPVTVPEMDFLHIIKKEFSADGIRYTKLRGKNIKKVSVCGGSGSFLLKDAISAGADIFISADFKYHQFFDAEDKIIIVDIGHYESEQFVTNIIYNLLKEKFSTFAASLSKIDTNPVNYL